MGFMEASQERLAEEGQPGRIRDHSCYVIFEDPWR